MQSCVAYHWRSALDLVRASGGDDTNVVEKTRLALRDSGDRAVALNSHAVAAAQYEDALALWPTDAADRPDLLFRLARALHHAYDERREDALAKARDALLEVGERELAAETEAFLWARSLVPRRWQGHTRAPRAGRGARR